MLDSAVIQFRDRSAFGVVCEAPCFRFDLSTWPPDLCSRLKVIRHFFFIIRDSENILGAFLLRFFYCPVYSDLLKIYFIWARSRVILETWGVLYKLLHCSILLLFGALEVYIDRILLTRYLHRFYFLCFHVVHKCSTRAPPFGNKPYSHTDVWCSRCVWIWVCVNLRANVYCELNTIPLNRAFLFLAKTWLYWAYPLYISHWVRTYSLKQSHLHCIYIIYKTFGIYLFGRQHTLLWLQWKKIKYLFTYQCTVQCD